MITVMATGCFDYLHKGHIHYLSEAKKHGDLLIVIIARDSTVTKEKGRRPHHTEKERLKAVQTVEFVDKAVLGSPHNKLTSLTKIKPDVLAIGYDQRIDEKTLNTAIKTKGLPTKLIYITAHRPNIYKSSILRRKHESPRTV